MWWAVDLVLIGFGVILVGFLVYIPLFAEFTRHRQKRPLTAEMLYIYLFCFAGASLLVTSALNLLESLSGESSPIPPAALEAIGVAQIVGWVTFTIAIVAGLIVVLYHRATGSGV
jgi:uncharacterized membrane protein